MVGGARTAALGPAPRAAPKPRPTTEEGGASSLAIPRNAGRQRMLEAFNFSFFGISGWGIVLDYCDIEWFALETETFCCF